MSERDDTHIAPSESERQPRVQRRRPDGPVIELSPREAGLKGIVGHWRYFEANRDRLLDAYSDLGVTSVRLAIDWRQIEPMEGRRDFSIVDRLFTALLERGIEPVPVYATIPTWASRNPAQCQAKEISCIPDQSKLEAFSRTTFRLVRRFPEVRRWEFWNEPEMWLGMADPSVFQIWHRAFYDAAKRANPNARVALGTLTGWNFVRGIDIDLPYDAVSMHTYEDHIGDPIDTQRIELTRRQLVAAGREVPIWLTEYGWDSQWLGDAERAAAFRWVFEWLRARPYIELAHYHMLHDTPHATECCFGLLGPPPAFVPKQPQAYATFRSYYAVQP
ncbi:MAG: cellulase family glycosylhydrolase [Thermomicrobiales bacterium]|nr:cellulase family glycosylhydrolase [Thermomicrobiales bacterium]